MPYAFKTWHRGWGDWAWQARTPRGEVFKSGSGMTRADAREQARAAIDARKLADKARWVEA